MIIAYATGALVMAWHLWTRRARVRKRWFGIKEMVDVALWPWVVGVSIVEGLLEL